MTGTGESLADTHIHMNRHMEAGGATLGFTVLWYYPVFCYLTEGQQLEEEGGRGGKDTPLLGWRETRERKPNPAPAPSPPPLFFLFFFYPTPLQTCHTQTNTLTRDHEVMYFNVYAQFHNRPLDSITLQGPWHTSPGSYTVRTTAVRHGAAYITRHPHETHVRSHWSQSSLLPHFSGSNQTFCCDV